MEFVKVVLPGYGRPRDTERVGSMQNVVDLLFGPFLATVDLCQNQNEIAPTPRIVLAQRRVGKSARE